MQYKFTYRRKWFWKTEVVTGHKLDEKQDKMILYYDNGSVQEIAHWRDCSIRLGEDWVNVTKKLMESQIGQSVPLNVNIK